MKENAWPGKQENFFRQIAKKTTERLSKNSMASLFLAFQDSSIGDLVSDWLTDLVSELTFDDYNDYNDNDRDRDIESDLVN